MTRLGRAILRLYPRPWRMRYVEEMRDLLQQREVGVGDLFDLVRGALDAHLEPQVRPQARPVLLAAGGGGAPVVRMRSSPTRSYGVVPAAGIGLISRRAFMRRVLGVGVGVLSLEFLGGTLAFLWPNIREGLGSAMRVGTLAQLLAQFPDWARGWPYHYAPAQTFLVNAPAARELAMGREASVSSPAAGEILALWRRCPHLACMIPELCPERKRFQCRCHGSTYNILGEKLEKGPAPRGMDRFPVSIDGDGILIIDTRQVISGAPAGQVTFRDPFPQNEGCE